VLLKQGAIPCSSTKLSCDLHTILRSQSTVFRKPHRLSRQVGKEPIFLVPPKERASSGDVHSLPHILFKTEHLRKLREFIFNQLALINLLLPSFLHTPAKPAVLGLSKKASSSEQSPRRLFMCQVLLTCRVSAFGTALGIACTAVAWCGPLFRSSIFHVHCSAMNCMRYLSTVTYFFILGKQREIKAL